MKTIIAGSRSINWYGALLLAINSCPWVITSVLSGKARGVDEMGEHWAMLNGMPLHDYPAQWETNGKRAGLIRNARMSIDGDAAVLVWDGVSRGTAHMRDCMLESNKPVHTVIIPKWL